MPPTLATLHGLRSISSALRLFSEKIPFNHVTACHEMNNLRHDDERTCKTKRDRGWEGIGAFDCTDRHRVMPAISAVNSAIEPSLPSRYGDDFQYC